MAEKKASPKVDAMRQAREARYVEQKAKRQAEVKALQQAADAIKPKPVKRPRKKREIAEEETP